MTAIPGPPRAGLARPLLVALVISVVTPLPGFLFGAVAVVMRRDIGFGIPSIGLGMAAFFAASAIACPYCGRVTERIGALWAMRIAAGGSGLTMLLMGLVPDSFVLVVALLALGGAVQGFASPAVNLYMSERISADRQGLAFGIKQASIPAALLISGASLPVLALTLGWRWVFALGALIGLLGLLLPSEGPFAEAGRHSAGARRVSAPTAPVPSWVVCLSIGAGLASFAPHSMGSFLVPTAVEEAHLSESAAGLLLSGGSVLALLMRLGAGALADRAHGGGLRTIGIMIAVGAVGLSALALGAPALVVAGASLAFAGGWGWASLFHLNVVRRNPRSPASATGAAQAGIYWGAAAAPLIFGLVLERSSYGVAWALAALVTAIAAALVFAADSGGP